MSVPARVIFLGRWRLVLCRPRRGLLPARPPLGLWLGRWLVRLERRGGR